MNLVKLKKAFKRALPELGVTLMRPLKAIWWWVVTITLALAAAGVLFGLLVAIFVHTKSTLLVAFALLVLVVIGKLAMLTHKHYKKLRH